jgi:hypothetical protein
MDRKLRAAYLSLLTLLLAISLLVADAGYETGYSYHPAEAQRITQRVVSKSSTSTIRRLSRGTKGELGEQYMDLAIRRLSRQIRDIDLHLNKSTYTHGIDGLFFNARRQRYIVTEAKATTNTGMLYEGLLGVTSAGRQMDTRWIRRSLQDAEFQANAILYNTASSAAQRRAARHILRSIEDVKQRSLRRTDRTLVVTRLLGVDGTPGVGNSIHPALARHFDNIIEVNRHGRTIAVYPGTRRP